MKVVLVFFAIIAVALAAEVKYTDKFNNFNVDEVLQNSRLLKGYVNCLLNKVVLVFFAIIVALAAELYSPKFDCFDVDSVLHSNRLLNGLVKCLLDERPCTIEGKYLKALLPDALATNCEKCTARQKEQSEKIIRFLVNEKGKFWYQLADKYDPNGIYREKHKEQAEAKGIFL